MNSSILKMYAVTPCHAGSGSEIGVVDLPIQREVTTEWPIIQATGMKGAMRQYFEHNCVVTQPETKKQKTNRIFGTEEDKGNMGSFSVSDAKILAFPMRSNVAPFVWITCLAVLRRLNKDLKLIGRNEQDIGTLGNNDDEALFVFDKSFNKDEQILLEDMVVKVKEQFTFSQIDKYFKEAEKLLIVSDAVFKYAVTNCTQIMAQIQIDQNTGTSKSGLRYQEELPTDTIMYSVVIWGEEHKALGDSTAKIDVNEIKKSVQDTIKSHIQVGGDETLGRGIFEINWI